jgi:Zn-dependent protease
MTDWWVHEYYRAGGLPLVVSWIFWVLFSITLHELSHGWAALWQGDDTPRRLGRMTINPLVHMGQWSLIMFAVVGIAWGVMPTDPGRYRWRRRGRAIVAVAGPAMNVLLAAVCVLAAAAWAVFRPVDGPLRENVYTFFFMGASLNVFLAGFNLLPVPPLDGANVLMGFSFRVYRLFQDPRAGMTGMFVLLILFASDLGDVLFAATFALVNRAIGLVTTVLGLAAPCLGSA